MEPTKTYTIVDLQEITGYSRRTIRYYVQEGLLDPPAGRGRGGFYFDSHLERLRQIKALQEKGLKLFQIQGFLREGRQIQPSPVREIWIRYAVEDGVEIQVRKDIDESQGKRVAEIVRLARSILKGGKGDE
jgi:DNA-binding transcriptional MerR regulator